MSRPHAAQLRGTLRRAAAARLRASVGVLVAGWLLAGAAGLTVYLRDYSLYRGFPRPVAPAGVATGRLRVLHFYSPALRQRRRYYVYLPAGYARAAARGRRYGVLYLLHAPPTHTTAYLTVGAMGVDDDLLARSGRLPPLLLVMPDGHVRTFRGDTEWANTRSGRFEDFVLDVVHSVDRHFATVRDRRHRVIAGLSEGGYGAVNITLHHLHTFGGMQSWSGYYRDSLAFSPVLEGYSRRRLDDASPAWRVPRIASRIRRLGLNAFLYTGTRDHEIPRRQLRTFAAELRAAGAHVTARIYPGGHDWALWRHQAGHMLRLASRWTVNGARRRPPAASSASRAGRAARSRRGAAPGRGAAARRPGRRAA
jgi:enterochelin esterase-like enzyme